MWDWKDGTCLGTMHGHRETVANLCLTASGTLFSSGIDKMVKVWKPPGSWGEEWHGLQELDLTTAGMVAEDVDRLEKQLRGEQALHGRCTGRHCTGQFHRALHPEPYSTLHGALHGAHCTVRGTASCSAASRPSGRASR